MEQYGDGCDCCHLIECRFSSDTCCCTCRKVITEHTTCGQRCTQMWWYDTRFLNFFLCYVSLNPKYLCGNCIILHWMVRLIILVLAIIAVIIYLVLQSNPHS